MSTLPTTGRPRPADENGPDANLDPGTGVSLGRVGPMGGTNTSGTGLIDRLPPHDLAAEVAVLGSMIIDPTVIGPVCMILPKPDLFFFDKHQVLYRVVVELFEKNTPMDPLVIASALRSQNQLDAVGGLDYLSEILNSVPTSAHAEYYANIVKEKAMLRSLIVACTHTLRDVYESGETASEVLDRGEKRIFDIAQQKVSSQAVPLTEALHETFAILDRNQGEHLTGIATGFVELDNLTSGLQRGEMIVLAARPSVGKTAFAMNLAEYVAVDQQRPVVVFSLEMSKQQLAQRMLCSRSGVDGHRLRRGMLSSQDRQALAMAVGQLSSGKMFIDDSPGLTLMDMRTKCRRLKLQHGIDLIVIDYLQLMEAPREENRQQQIASISRGVKALARELNVPVICLSQLNRASESEQRLPRTSDLRESGSIEQDADVVMLLHREAVMHRGDQEWMDANPDKINAADLIIAKQRNGPCDTVKLTFLSGSTRFANYTPTM